MEKRDDTTTMENNINGLKKGPWSSKEDEILAAYVKKHGEGNWNAVQNNSGLARCGKSCRLRWVNHLKPDLKKGSFSIPEQQKIIHLHAIFGTKWSKIALELPGRTDNEIKNFWNTRKRKLERAGLPLYPAHIKPKKMNDDNRESVSGNFSSQQGNVSQEDDSLGAGSTSSISNIPTSSALIDDSLGGNSVISPSDIELPPFPPCIEVDDSAAPILSCYNETFRLPPIPNSPSPLPPPSLGGNYVMSPPDMVPGLPPFPPVIEIDDSAAPILLYHEFYHIPPMIPYSPPPPPEEETQNQQLLPEEPPVSPRSSGLLESILYPPKVVSEDEKGKQQQQQPNNSLEKGGDGGSGSNQRDLTNLDALVDLGWLDNDWDKDRYDDVKDTLYAVVLEGYRRSKK